MRIVMPLFEYSSSVEKYSFKSFPFRIEKLSIDDLIEMDLFSKNDLSTMRRAEFCLIFDDEKFLSEYDIKSFLLLMSFHISIPYLGPFIQYRICKKDFSYCSRISEPITHNYESNLTKKRFTQEDLDKTDIFLERLIEMERISNRTKNALYFKYKSMISIDWIPCFMMSMASIESLFSKDKEGGATKIIKSRVTNFLKDPNVTEENIEELYRLRSDMVHGRVTAGDSMNNLKYLANLQFILSSILYKLLDEQSYKVYETKSKRDNFMGTLNSKR